LVVLSEEAIYLHNYISVVRKWLRVTLHSNSRTQEVGGSSTYTTTPLTAGVESVGSFGCKRYHTECGSTRCMSIEGSNKGYDEYREYFLQGILTV